LWVGAHNTTHLVGASDGGNSAAITLGLAHHAFDEL
jgi:hypothetical protein